MLSIKNIFKQYKTGDFIQKALNGVSLDLRDNEFVAILGPSGSGKTTLLNIIGGLDQYDQGDLIIDEVSTKNYKDKDWDSYRNHSVGMVFQSYNLIPHQSVLSNVELALTISGISKEERKRRAEEALIKVGLKDHMHKKPNQLSGGQMQRVAIARALVNDPEILLADEPTGALDTETSIQIMELLKEVANDRLVVMVTHNPELANDYATRIVSLKDGEIINDTNPIIHENMKPAVHRNFGKTTMSFWTALQLSFNNLKTKKARTFLTAFAGSIGIIGIAMILSISTGVDTYITDIQKETMSSYPITIQAESIDLSGIIENSPTRGNLSAEVDHDLDKVYSNPTRLNATSNLTSNISENNLTAFKRYLDDPNSEIHQYIGENGIVYSYATKFDLYSEDSNGALVNTDGTDFSDNGNTVREQGIQNFISLGNPSNASGPNISQFTGESQDNNTEELTPGQGGSLVSTAIIDQFEVVAGAWPNAGDQIVLVLDQNNEIPSSILYQLGLLPNDEYKDVMDKIDNGEEVVLDTQSFYYDDIIGRTYHLLTESDYYIENENGTFDYVGHDEDEVRNLLNSAQPVTITGIVRASDSDARALISSTIGYTKDLTDYIINHTNESAVVRAQEASPDINVLNDLTFSPQDDAAKINDAIIYLENLNVSDKAQMMIQILTSMGQGEMAAAMGEEQLAAYLDNFLEDPDDEALLEIYDNYISSGSYDKNLEAFGKVSLDAPSEIALYTDTFEAKDRIETSIEDYNKTVSEDDQITYTDFVGLLMSSVTTIINVITWVLIAFVAVSLVVSSIMIGIITYISVLERTKEIGILRSIGASKWNITEVFTAETFIIGLLSGFLGIITTLLLLIPTNLIIHDLMDTTMVNARLPFGAAIGLIILSVILTLIGGYIPARKAAQKDPVLALRTE